MDEVAIFTRALDLEPADQRAAYLDEACAGDANLRDQVDKLLCAHGRAGNFLDNAAAAWNAQLPIGGLPSMTERPGTVIGPYKLLEQIGEGGMGLVFMAEQLQPVRRRVALKILKPGMDTRQVVARFEAERQALAMMDHANIAKIFDAGMTESGRPYFVMELVHGVPITTYCDQHRLTPRQRLELFATVCHAVQHAHQKGIIHRDLKPSNVLVSLHDTVPVPKVIDFGIAKATGERLTENTLFTHFSQIIGTPLYMSPEQAEMNGLGIDTRSDVYALGVMLYELLTGATPFDSETLKKVGYDEMRRIIREDEPPRPSQRVSTLEAAACTTISARRSVDERRLGPLLRGELDWIVMKALEKDRNRRYESASALAADVQRYLNDEPVEACPPSAGYRLRKFARRNRRLVATAAAFVLVLVAATAVSTWQAVDANAARRLADERLENEKKALDAAATEAAIASAVNDFLQVDLLGQVNTDPQVPDEFSGYKNLTVKEALDRAAAKIGDRFQEQPLVEAAIRTAIGEAYRSLYEFSLARPQLEKAIALRRANLGPDHRDTLKSMQKLANYYRDWGRSRDAVLMMVEVVERYERMLGSDHSTTLEGLSDLAVSYGATGDLEKAIALAKQVLDKRKAAFGSSHASTLGAMHTLSRLYLDAGLLKESLELHEETMVIWKSTNPQNNWTWLFTTYARALQGAGRHEDAERHLRTLLELNSKQKDRRGREFGAAHLGRILAQNLLLQKRYIEAESVARKSLAILQKERPNHWYVFCPMSLVGGALLGQKKFEDAEPFLVQGYEGLKLHEASGKDMLAEAGQRLLRFYEVTDQPEKARILREKLAKEKTTH